MSAEGSAPPASSSSPSHAAAEEPIGLVAGNGTFPLLFAREARARGRRVVAVAHRGETDEALEGAVEDITWIRVGQLGKLLRTLRRAGVRRAVFAGGIDKVRSLTQIRPDLRGLLFLRRAAGLGDDALLRALAAELEGDGIEVVASTFLLDRLLARPGLISGPRPGAAALADIRLGASVLAALGPLDIGQGVVVERGVVLAVEAVEGTDEAMRRAGRLGRGAAVVVKAAKHGQDMRFDVPAVGPRTIDVMREAGVRVLAVEAGKTLLLEQEALVRKAAEARITVVGCDAAGSVEGYGDA